MAVLRVRGRGALLSASGGGRGGGGGAPALLLDPGRAVSVDLVAHTVGTAHRQVGLRALQPERKEEGYDANNSCNACSGAILKQMFKQYLISP